MNLPPFPSGYLPSSPEERLRLLQWAESAVKPYMEDAERYRWLKERSRCDMMAAGVDLNWYVPTENLDAAIDAARNEQHSTDGGTE